MISHSHDIPVNYFKVLAGCFYITTVVVVVVVVVVVDDDDDDEIRIKIARIVGTKYRFNELNTIFIPFIAIFGELVSHSPWKLNVTLFAMPFPARAANSKDNDWEKRMPKLETPKYQA